MQKIQIKLAYFPPLNVRARNHMHAQYEFIEFEVDNPTISKLIEFLQRVYKIPIDQLSSRIVAKNGRAVGLLLREGFKPYSDADLTLSNGDYVSFSARIVGGG